MEPDQGVLTLDVDGQERVSLEDELRSLEGDQHMNISVAGFGNEQIVLSLVYGPDSARRHRPIGQVKTSGFQLNRRIHYSAEAWHRLDSEIIHPIIEILRGRVDRATLSLDAPLDFQYTPQFRRMVLFLNHDEPYSGKMIASVNDGHVFAVGDYTKGRDVIKDKSSGRYHVDI